MNRRVSLALSLAFLAACQESEPTTPNQVVPSLAISDGGHSAGNADFFFLPPMVWPTSSLSNWTRDGFNPSLSPSVEICPLNTGGTACATASGFPVVISGTAVKKHFPPVADPADQITGLPGDWAHYHAKWRMPNSCAVAIYRVFVKVGSTELGYADVKCVTRLLDLLRVDYRNFGAGLRGQDVQIPFRIERFALCDIPGVGPCGSASVLLTTATTTPLQDPGTGALIGSVTIPVQDVPSTTAPVVVNVEPCPDLRSRAVDPLDLPTFGPCLRITTDPEIDLSNAATVFICSIAGVSGGQNQGVASEEQEHRITLHRRDEGEGATVVALPHVVGCPVVTASLGQRLTGVLAALSGRRWNEAGNRLFDVVAPKPLYARRFIDQGGGGLTEEFSDFQFALPCALRVDAGNNQTGDPSSTLALPAKARCVDLGDEGVNGARVHFAPGAGSGTVGSAAVTTSGGGYAESSWTLGSAPGQQTLRASGFGLAGTDYNGPRCDAVDPFMVIQGAPTPPEFRGTAECGEESNDPSSPILLRTGSVTSNATATVGVLIYGPSLGTLGTVGSLTRTDNEATLATAAGYDVTVVDAAAWANLTSADFGSYKAIVFGDPTCVSGTTSLSAADANKAVWSAVATGPAVIIGTDPQFHTYTGAASAAAAKQLITNGIKYAASGASTGLYVSLSCYYYTAGTPTPVPFLSAIGSFSVVGQFSGFSPNAVTIQEAAHPVMNLLTSALLSNWGESVHEAFPLIAGFPATFHAVATVANGVEQLPYIIVR